MTILVTDEYLVRKLSLGLIRIRNKKLPDPDPAPPQAMRVTIWAVEHGVVQLVRMDSR